MTVLDALLLFVGIPVVLFVNTRGFVLFQRLCTRIARREGRVAERQSIQCDDGGLNAYEHAQFSALWRRDYERFGDAELDLLGDRAVSWMAWSLALSVATVIVAAVRFG